MTRSTVHISLDLVGALGAWARWDGVILDDGRPLTREEVETLVASGVRRIPLGPPCEGYSFKTGCPGHAQPDDLAPALGAEEKGIPDA